MDLYYEQRLRDEVIYLHSLWHQGPPPRPNPNPNSSRLHHHLPPSNPPQFKKRRRKKKGKKIPPPPHSDLPPPVSDVEWPCNPPAPTAADPSSSSGWPALAPAPAPATRLPTPEERAQFAATQLQKRAVFATEGFFAGNLDGDGDDGDSDEDDLMEEDDGYEEFQFFLKLFTEEDEAGGELRGYYEKNWEGGDFVCLVCRGIGKNKRFKHCVALVQHSVTVARTKKKKAHRAYAQVICRVLGWDIDRLPSVVLPPPDNPVGRSIESQGNPEVGIGESSMLTKDSGLVNVHNGESALKEVSDVGQEEELHSSADPGSSNVLSDNVMLLENSLNVGDANKGVENHDNGVSSLVDWNIEGVINCLEHSKDNVAADEVENHLNGIEFVNEPEGDYGNTS